MARHEQRDFCDCADGKHNCVQDFFCNTTGNCALVSKKNYGGTSLVCVSHQPVCLFGNITVLIIWIGLQSKNLDRRAASIEIHSSDWTYFTEMPGDGRTITPGFFSRAAHSSLPFSY